MIYYDKEGRAVDFNGSNTNLEGANGEIFRCPNNIAYKRYFSYAENKIKQSIFDFIKSINNPHMVKLLERYYLAEDILDLESFLYYVNNVERDSYVFNKDFQKIDLYTYQWVEKEYIDILEQPVDYLLDNLNELLRLADFLSLNGVKMNDMKIDSLENLICNKNKIILIDPDMYYFIDSQDNKSKLMLENRKCILQLLKSICQKLTEYKGEVISRNIDELFDSSIKDPRYGVSILSKKLSGYKMPIDYVARTK